MILPPPSLIRFPDDLEYKLLEFEEAWAKETPVDPRAFCPPSPDSACLLELVCIDVARRQKAGLSTDIHYYWKTFPELKADTAASAKLKQLLSAVIADFDPEKTSEHVASATRAMPDVP